MIAVKRMKLLLPVVRAFASEAGGAGSNPGRVIPINYKPIN